MKKTLDSILGGTINGYGGIDVNYQPSGFSVGLGGQIKEKYKGTGFGVGRDGSIRGNYGEHTGMGVDLFGNIKKAY